MTYHILAELEISPRCGQLWICKTVNVNCVQVRESELRENEAGYENRYVMTSCSSDYKMFIYFNLLDMDTNWSSKFTLNFVQISFICNGTYF